MPMNYRSLELDDLLASFISEFSFAEGQFLAFLGGAEEEPGVDLSLLVLQTHVTGQDVTVLKA
jgi:hypothetical protein